MRTLTSAKLLFAFIAVLAFGSHGNGQDVALNTANLVIRLISPLGGNIPRGELSIRSRNGDSVLSESLKNEYFARVPYGEYVVRFSGQFLKSVQREVTINKPDLFLVLAIEMDDIVLDVPHEQVSVSIRVVPRTSCSGDLWAKIVGVYTSYTSEARISDFGFALFDSITPASYLIIIVDGDKIRGVQSFATRGPVTKVEIPLGKCE